MDLLRQLLQDKDPQFWTRLQQLTREAGLWSDLLRLSGLGRKAARTIPPPQQGEPLRLAIMGGYTFQPFAQILEHLLRMNCFFPDIVQGDYDNHVSEMLDPANPLLSPAPQVCVIIPPDKTCQCPCAPFDPRSKLEAAAATVAEEILSLCHQARQRLPSQLILANFRLPPAYDPGSLRTRSLTNPWCFHKQVNLELGLRAPEWLTIWDLEYTSCRVGIEAADDTRGFYETKQMGSSAFQFAAVHDLVHLVRGLRLPTKKVLVCDLDNTLWGGIIGDDGLENIEIGPPSPRGEAFLAFQHYIKNLRRRGILLAVCSKNQKENAELPFLHHPHMALRLDDFVSFKANWLPKSDNLAAIAAELNLSPDSLVFVDDSPAEIDLVRRFLPQVTALLLGQDPANYVGQLDRERLFEPGNITREDTQRTEQYARQILYRQQQLSFADMDSYLSSLNMVGVISPLTPSQLPRITQLINKSNQFNLTTRRRTIGEVTDLIGNPSVCAFSMRLQDLHGDHGLIGIIIAHQAQTALIVDTWVMSCRVLSRQVEEEMINQLVRCAVSRHCTTIRASYLVTARNGLVATLLDRLGFELLAKESSGNKHYQLYVPKYQHIATHIRVHHDGESSHEPVPGANLPNLANNF